MRVCQPTSSFDAKCCAAQTCQPGSSGSLAASAELSCSLSDKTAVASFQFRAASVAFAQGFLCDLAINASMA